MTNSYKKTEATNIGLSLLYESLAADKDSELMGLIGACSYAGEVSIYSTATGKHFYFMCPNERTHVALRQRSLDLWFKLEAIFPITRLFLCTVDDPARNVPADYWQSAGVIPVGGTWLGLGKADNHPNWFIVAKLDEDGMIIR